MKCRHGVSSMEGVSFEASDLDRDSVFAGSCFDAGELKLLMRRLSANILHRRRAWLRT